jgi:hypothetical protein
LFCIIKFYIFEKKIMRTYLKKVTDRVHGLTYWKLKIKTTIIECLTNEEIFELEDIIKKYLKENENK